MRKHKVSFANKRIGLKRSWLIHSSIFFGRLTPNYEGPEVDDFPMVQFGHAEHPIGLVRHSIGRKQNKLMIFRPFIL